MPSPEVKVKVKVKEEAGARLGAGFALVGGFVLFFPFAQLISRRREGEKGEGLPLAREETGQQRVKCISAGKNRLF